MYEKLIEKIIKLKRVVGSIDSDSWNEAINNSIKIIKASEPQWLDKPIDEGWHWTKWHNPELEDNGEINSCVKVIENEFGNLEVEGKEDVFSKRYSFFKWQKAIVPK